MLETDTTGWMCCSHAERQSLMVVGEMTLVMVKGPADLWSNFFMGQSDCQGASETGNVSRPSAHGTPTDLRNGHSRGRIPAECLEQKMLYAYATVCTQGDFTLSRK